MSFARTWSGDWHGRILERVRQRGFNSASEFAAERTGASLIALADELGQEDIAAAQLRSVLVEEATHTNTVPRLLRDLLVRELRGALPRGWVCPLGDESRSRVAGAVADWWAELKEHLIEGATFDAGRALLDADLAAGWLPEGPDDPVIVAFVDRCIGRTPS